MRPVTETVTGVGTSTPVLIDRYLGPINIGIGCIATGTVSYTVEHSYEAPPVNWFPDTVIATQTGNKENPNFTASCQYIRLNIATGTGTVVMTIVQSGGAT